MNHHVILNGVKNLSVLQQTISESMQRFGDKLRILRKRRGLTMRELADALEMRSHGSIGDFESGRSQPSIDLIVKIADFFGVSLDQLARDDVELE